ncbi:MAG: hypothetical protein EOP05_17250 [Proteobacteria bacterium]|nr:MAG: hypothetical protein EOP05_17250 [Pseudomonadota bacterium]
MPAYELLKLNPDAILTGVISSSGLVAPFSSEGADVTILSPSESFTSQAQPLTAGSLVNVMAMLPGITPRELKQILVATALHSANTPKSNGVGVLNSYRMVKVADRLQHGWPNNRATLATKELFDFRQEAAEILASGESVRTAYLLDDRNPKIQSAFLKSLLETNQQEAHRFFDGLVRKKSLSDIRTWFSANPKSGLLLRRLIDFKDWKTVETVFTDERYWSESSWPPNLDSIMQAAVWKFDRRAEIHALLWKLISNGPSKVSLKALRMGVTLRGLNNAAFFEKAIQDQALRSEVIGDYVNGEVEDSPEIRKLLTGFDEQTQETVCREIRSAVDHYSRYDKSLPKQMKSRFPGCFK